MPARPGKTSTKHPKGAIDPCQPLRLAQRELFAQIVAQSVPVPEAYGSVTGYEDDITVTLSCNLSGEAMAPIKSVGTKAERIQVDMHDKLQAMMALAKVLGMTQDGAASSRPKPRKPSHKFGISSRRMAEPVSTTSTTRKPSP